ncbi:hypothetical protein FMUND_7386 [Fusarium mundagurra]|uniref:Extracellular membrane protein CFEM domain-containing protein n=1 Tax=Fusarium mundagurra TaxID=1567541 RepID=A0A8H5YNH4_9HYPO|nr:hypothetical protein FMUND_7386 [Fusarium mundagurra]
MHFSTLAALIAISGFTSAEPNGWSKTKEADDSPSKLDDCGCWPIYQAILKCQKLKWPKQETRDCVCIPNPDGWYGSMDGCRTCLSSNSEHEFFDNTAKLVTQLFVSCTNAGGGVTSDGNSICASNAYREACVSLGTNGKPSWASFEQEGVSGNGTYVLDIKEFGADDESTSTSTTSAKTTTKTTVAESESTGSTEATSVVVDATTGTTKASSGSATSDATSGTETPVASATTAPNSAMRLAGHGAVGMGLVAVVGAILL